MIACHSNNRQDDGFAPLITIIGAAALLVVGIVVGNFVQLPGIKQPLVKPSVLPTPTSEVTATPASEATTSSGTNGTISGYLIYPSDHIPPQVMVCAELVSNTTVKTCVNQISDQKYVPTGVGYEMSLPPGEYYVYSVLGDWRAYFNEFVTCGLKASCPSHAKIPVVVTANSINDQILPHDWYDTITPTVINQISVTPVPMVSIIPTLTKINPGSLQLLPTSTPIPTIKVIPTLKKINFGF